MPNCGGSPDEVEVVRTIVSRAGIRRGESFLHDLDDAARAEPSRSAQQHGQRYIPQFFAYVPQGDLDPSILIAHDLPLADGVHAYEVFKN